MNYTQIRDTENTAPKGLSLFLLPHNILVILFDWLSYFFIGVINFVSRQISSSFTQTERGRLENESAGAKKAKIRKVFQKEKKNIIGFNISCQAGSRPVEFLLFLWPSGTSKYK